MRASQKRRLHDYLTSVDRKPYPSLEAMRSSQLRFDSACAARF
jgi:hypothetical protein